MSETIAQRQLRNDNAEIMRRVEAGETFVVTRNRPVPHVRRHPRRGVLATLVRAAGRDPRPRRLDLQIAATAAASRLPLVTANPRDFAGVGRMVDVIAI